MYLQNSVLRRNFVGETEMTDRRLWQVSNMALEACKEVKPLPSHTTRPLWTQRKIYHQRRSVACFFYAVVFLLSCMIFRLVQQSFRVTLCYIRWSLFIGKRDLDMPYSIEEAVLRDTLQWFRSSRPFIIDGFLLLWCLDCGKVCADRFYWSFRPPFSQFDYLTIKRLGSGSQRVCKSSRHSLGSSTGPLRCSIHLFGTPNLPYCSSTIWCRRGIVPPPEPSNRFSVPLFGGTCFTSIDVGTFMIGCLFSLSPLCYLLQRNLLDLWPDWLTYTLVLKRAVPPTQYLRGSHRLVPVTICHPEQRAVKTLIFAYTHRAAVSTPGDETSLSVTLWLRSACSDIQIQKLPRYITHQYPEPWYLLGIPTAYALSNWRITLPEVFPLRAQAQYLMRYLLWWPE